MAEDIRQFGESLLADVRKRNDDLYKRQKKEAYKMALLQTGVSLINNTVQDKAAQFLASEEAMAARVKQKRGVDDARFFISQQDKIDSSGKTAEEFFEEQMLPYATELAKEQFKEENFNPDSYNAYIRQQVRVLAQQRAQQHNQGYEAANQLSSPEDFAAFQLLHSSKEKSAFDWVAGSIRNLFTGKDRAEIDRETIEAISNSPEIQRAETVTALRKAFNQTGSVSIAQDIASAVESGQIEKLDEKFRVEAGEIVSGKGPFGEDLHYQSIVLKDSQGSVVVGEDGEPAVFLQPLQGRGGNIPSALSNVVDSLTTGERTTMADTITSINSIASDLEKRRYEKFLNEFSINEKGEVDPSITTERIAAQAKVARVEHGIDQQDAEALMSRVFLNRITSATEGLGTLSPNKFNFTTTNLSDKPDSIEYIKALADLEGTAYAVEFDFNQLDSMLGNIAQDFAKYDPASRVRILDTFSDDSRYSFLHATNPLGERVIDILLEINERSKPPGIDDFTFMTSEEYAANSNVYTGTVQR